MDDLKILRIKIDKIDASIIKKLAQRQKISQKIGSLKAISKKKVKDVAREKQQEKQYQKLCAEYQIDFHLINQLFSLIRANSRILQKKY